MPLASWLTMNYLDNWGPSMSSALLPSRHCAQCSKCFVLYKMNTFFASLWQMGKLRLKKRLALSPMSHSWEALMKVPSLLWGPRKPSSAAILWRPHSSFFHIGCGLNSGDSLGCSHASSVVWTAEVCCVLHGTAALSFTSHAGSHCSIILPSRSKTAH